MGAKVSCAQTGFVRKGLGARELRAGEACLCVGIVYASAVCVDTVCALTPCARWNRVCVGAACIYAVYTGSVCVEAVCALTPRTQRCRVR